jgi:hypothetical protein
MADLNGLESSQSVKIAGADSSGSETNYVNSSSNGELKTSDIINVQGVYGTITVGTSPVEVKVGALNLTERKLVTIDNTSNTILYWAYSSSISTTNFAGRIFKDQQIFLSVGPNVSVYLIAGSSGNSVRISEGA